MITSEREIGPTMAFNQLLADLEASLEKETEERRELTLLKETLIEQEARTALDERATGRKMTETEIKERVAINEVVLSYQTRVRNQQKVYDLAKMLSEIARYRVQFALSAARYREGAID